MNLLKTELGGVYLIDAFFSEDSRGSFTKTYHELFFLDHNLCTNFKENYFSKSKKNVIRGMHFQLPPHDHEKLVTVAQGRVIDVVLDLRKTSQTYGKSIEVILSDENHRSIYIPKGFAHGFRTMIDNTIMIYNTSTVYNAEHDSGIKYDSFNFDWNISSPFLSERDKQFGGFENFKKINPFN